MWYLYVMVYCYLCWFEQLSHFYIAGLAQDCSVSSALAMAIVQSCTKSLISFITVFQEYRYNTCPSDLSTKADFEVRVIYQHCLDSTYYSFESSTYSEDTLCDTFMSWFTAIYVDVHNLSHFYTTGFVQDCSISSALAMVIVQPCTEFRYITCPQTCPLRLTSRSGWYINTAWIVFIIHSSPVHILEIHFVIHLCHGLLLFMLMYTIYPISILLA